MNGKHQLLIRKLKNSSGKKEFFGELKYFFEEYFEKVYFKVVKLNPFPPFYLPLSDSQDIESLLKEFSNCSQINQKGNFVIVNSNYIYPLTKEINSAKYLLVFDNQINNYSEKYTKLFY